MEIESFFNDSTKEFSKYQNDLRTKRAVERNIEIIGEALYGTPQSSYRRLVDFR